MAQLFQQILFQSPPSLYLKITQIVTLFGSLQAGYSEIKGVNLTYSKFSQTREINAKRISSRNGMLICYGPALMASSMFLIKCIPSTSGLLSSIATVDLHQASPRLLLLASALTIHFLKRELEVMFLHRYSSDMVLQTSFIISFSYFLQTVNLLYAQQLSEGMPSPPIDLMWLGVAVFWIGIGGNFYHHYLLSRLRKDGKGGYMVPQGGLFNLVVCPHYLFEIMAWLGMTLISQSPFSFASLCFTTLYLTGRSYATRQWYLQKMEDFPKQRKALFPFIF